ncbi:hypothetical protein KCW65_25530, partial [Mycobacterium tuberculosis]|nr:hypothetical protein [Mycobacterium tuberculosis]
MAFGYPDGANNILNASMGTDLLSWDVPQSSTETTVSAADVGEMRIADLRVRDEDPESPRWTTLRTRICAYSLPDEVGESNRGE